MAKEDAKLDYEPLSLERTKRGVRRQRPPPARPVQVQMVNEDKVNVRTDEEIVSTGQGSGPSSGDPGGQGSLNQRDTSGYPNI